MTTLETLAELLIRRGAEQPVREALTFLGDDGAAVGLTYAELDARARAIAAVLSDTCRAGDRALLLYPPGPEYVAGFFGCLYAGVIAVPAYPPLDARQASRLTGIAADAAPAAVLTESAFLDLARDLLEPVLREAGVPAAWLATDTVTPVDDASPVRHNAERIAFLQYTSGSTGQPKGVVVTHANLLHNSAFIQDRFGHTEASRGVIWLPPYHDMGLIGGILQPVFAGFPVTLMSPLSFLRDPMRWLRAVSDYGATTSGGPNFAYDLAVRKTTPAQREALDLSRWTVAFTGAEQVRPATLDAFAEAFAPAGFRRRAYFPCYGLAEATLMVTGVRHDADPEVTAFGAEALAAGRAVPAREDDARPLVSCGTPPADATVGVIDLRDGSPVEEGTVGEITVSGPSVAAGYWGGRDAEVFADGRVRTGDLGFLYGGQLFVTGRRKDLIIVRGRNIAPDDIELAAGRAHSALRPGCGAAIAVDAGAEELLAVVHEVQGPKPLPLAEVAAAVRTAVLGEHGVAVSRVVLLGKGGLPKTSSGKIRRFECRRALAAGELPVLFDDDAAGMEKELGSEAGSTSGTAPRPEPAQSVASRAADVLPALAAEVLGVAKRDLGPDAPLAAFGLESVKAAELAVRAEAAGLRLDLRDLMSGADLRALAASATAVPAAPAAEPTDALTEGERAMWFLHRLAPDSTAYHLGHAVEISGPFSAARFTEALQAAIGRHAALRTRFGVRDGEPYRIVGQSSVDWASLEASGTDLDIAIQTLIDEPFDLESGPLWRIRHWHLDDDRHVLALAVHHITADLWSLTALVRELLGSAQKAPATMAAAVQAERAYLATAEARHALDRWRDRLADPPEPLDLPTDRPRPAVQSFRGARHLHGVPPETAHAVEALAASEQVSPYAVLLAAYAWLLHAYTGASDLVVGAPAPGRLSADTADVLGLAVNVVPVRCELTAAATFQDTVRHVASRLREALAGQRIPLPRLVELAHPDRDPGRSPLVQTLFALQQAPADDPLAAFLLEAGSTAIGDLRVTSRPVTITGAQLDLSLEIVRTGDSLRCGLTYDTALWDADTAVRFADHFTTLLAAAVADPTTTADRIDLGSTADHADSTVPQPPESDELIHEAIDRHAERTPHATAIRDGDRAVSYARLKRWSDALAHQLHELGVGPESRVGLLADRSAEFIVSVLAVWKAGAAYVPLDTDHPTPRLVAVARDAGISLLIGSGQQAAELARALSSTMTFLDPAQPVAEPDAPVQTARPDNAAYVMYTSGSTGEPKGVCVTHTGVVNLLDELACEADDVCAWWTSGGFDVSVFEIFTALRSGAVVDVVPAAIRPHAEQYVDWLADRGVTHAYVPPFALAALEERISRQTLRRLVVSVEPTPEPLLRRIAAGRPGLSVVNGYGPTEATIFATLHHLDPDGSGSGMVPIGRAVRNCPARVLDAAGRLVPVGVPGELFVGGVGLARGYFGRPGATAEAFVPDPFAGRPGARMYRTGDVVRLRPDGHLRFLGRRDQQVKLRGVRIELGEVQAALAAQPGVASALAVVRHVGGQPVLIGYVVPTAPDRADNAAGQLAGQSARQPAAPDAADLRARLRAVLPAPMVPSAVVVLDAWPVTVNGKLDRRALPLPEAVRALAFEPPAGDRERTVAAIIGELLGGRRVGRHDDFFDLGGHSLLAAQAALQIGGALGLDVPVVALFSHPSVAGLTEALAAAATPFAPITALPRAHDDPDALAARLAALPDAVVQLLTDEVSGA